jgi:hypothetical protein
MKKISVIILFLFYVNFVSGNSFFYWIKQADSTNIIDKKIAYLIKSLHYAPSNKEIVQNEIYVKLGKFFEQKQMKSISKIMYKNAVKVLEGNYVIPPPLDEYNKWFDRKQTPTKNKEDLMTTLPKVKKTIFLNELKNEKIVDFSNKIRKPYDEIPLRYDLENKYDPQKPKTLSEKINDQNKRKFVIQPKLKFKLDSKVYFYFYYNYSLKAEDKNVKIACLLKAAEFNPNNAEIYKKLSKLFNEKNDLRSVMIMNEKALASSLGDEVKAPEIGNYEKYLPEYELEEASANEK